MAQRCLHTGAMNSSRWQNCNTTCSAFRPSASSSVTCRTNRSIVGDSGRNFGRRVFPLSSSFQGLQMLHVPLTGLQVYKLGSSSDQRFASFSSHPCKTFSIVNFCLDWNSIRVLTAYSQSIQRRASKGDRSISEEAEEKDQEIPEEIKHGVEGEKENSDRETNGDKENADRPQAKKADYNDSMLQNKRAESGPWWRFRKQGPKVEEDVLLDFEEESRLQDLESLTFTWRDFFDPTWDNALALGCTLLLTLGLFKILFEAILVFMTLLTTALKYTFLGSLMLGLLIFLI